MSVTRHIPAILGGLTFAMFAKLRPPPKISNFPLFSVFQTDLEVLIDLIPPEDLQKIARYIGEQKVNEPAFCRILSELLVFLNTFFCY